MTYHWHLTTNSYFILLLFLLFSSWLSREDTLPRFLMPDSAVPRNRKTVRSAIRKLCRHGYLPWRFRDRKIVFRDKTLIVSAILIHDKSIGTHLWDPALPVWHPWSNCKSGKKLPAAGIHKLRESSGQLASTDATRPCLDEALVRLC